jgi:hypothetical protein
VLALLPEPDTAPTEPQLVAGNGRAR